MIGPLLAGYGRNGRFLGFFYKGQMPLTQFLHSGKKGLSSKLGSLILHGKKDTFMWWLFLLHLWSMDDGGLRELLEKPGTVKDIGVLSDKARSVGTWGAPG